MTTDYIIALLSTGWKIKRSSIHSAWMRYKEGERTMPLAHRDQPLIMDMVNRGLLEFVSEKTRLQVRKVGS